MAMTQARKLMPTATVDDALRDAFRHVEAQPVPAAIEALVERLAGEPIDGADAES